MRSHNECCSQHFWGVGFIALLNAARCNCSLNNHLSGVVRPDIHRRPAQCPLPLWGQSNTYSGFSLSPRTVPQAASSRLITGDIPHSKWYIHLIWSRHVSSTLTEARKQAEPLCCRKFRLQTSPDNHTQTLQIHQTMVSHESYGRELSQCSVLSLSIGSPCQQLHFKEALVIGRNEDVHF